MTLKKEDLIKKVGINIRRQRVEKDFTLEKLAFESGIEYSQISRIERGIINTSVYHVYMISKTLKIPMNFIFIDL